MVVEFFWNLKLADFRYKLQKQCFELLLICDLRLDYCLTIRQYTCPGWIYFLSFPLLVKCKVKTDHYQIILQIKSCIFNIGYGRVKYYMKQPKKFENYSKIIARKIANSAINKKRKKNVFFLTSML